MVLLGASTLDVAPMVVGASYLPEVVIDPAMVAPATEAQSQAGISTLETDDPRVNKHKDDWKQRTGNSLGAVNSIYSIGKPPGSVLPPQDLDSAGNLTGYSLYMPAPRGMPGNSKGLVTSVAELGYIHTGLEGSAKAGVPWRTLHLQPSKQDNKIVPDWAFMDLFAVPPEVAEDSALQVLRPQNGAMGGRVNLNAVIEPFSLERLNPLTAVFLGAKKADGISLSLTAARTLATNVLHHTLAPSGKNFGEPQVYDSPGEVIEIKGVADGGESSEELVREISNQITARGGVFCVYSIGQTLKQTSDGRLLVLAEQRTQSFVERLQDPNGGVSTRVIYSRRLAP